MKDMLYSLFAVLLMVGCGEDVKDGLYTEYYDNGQKSVEETYWEGKLDGNVTWWHPNGNKKWERHYKEGKLDGPSTRWHKNGQKGLEENFKEGKLDGLQTGWYENGQKRGEGTFVGGKLMSAVEWKPNGGKCPETNLKDGNGTRVFYHDDGTEYNRETYKDGKLDSD
jgi:antitoxin component YwqK of YwqJK toxin-antitoxin module